MRFSERFKRKELFSLITFCLDPERRMAEGFKRKEYLSFMFYVGFFFPGKKPKKNP